MSTDSEDQKRQQALLAQLWSIGGDGENAGVDPISTYLSAGHALANAQSMSNNGGSNNNNNYVNFNQFIMQHNLLGGGGGGSVNNGSSSGGGTNGQLAAATQANAATKNGGDYGNGGYFPFASTSANKTSNNTMDSLQQTNYFNSNLFQYDAGMGDNGSNSNLYANGHNNYSNTKANPTTSSTQSNNFKYYDSVYTPFGNIGGGGDETTYFANPFATGFDFNASNLQASAPEFVPRFTQLSLNENTDDAGTAVTSNGNSAAAPNEAKPLAAKNITTYPEGSSTTSSALAAATTTDDIFSKAATFSLDVKPYKNTQRQRNHHHDSKRYSSGYISPGNTSNNHATKSSETSSAMSFSSGAPMGANSSSSASSLARSTGASNKTTRSTSSNGFGGNVNGNGNYNHNNNSNSSPSMDKSEKSSTARAERERERDNRRYQNGRRSVDYHRSNKRRDDWNRNRDRVNGFRVEEKYSNDNGKDSPLPSPEKKPSPRKIYPENEKLSQREKLIRDIETRRLECLVCVEPIKAHHQVWSCNNCYHILHLQCITKWASSSKSDDGWRCPACQNVVKEVPHDYYCFCGQVKNPSYSRQDIPHSCGNVCSRVEGCTHACTLLCHPGPCPACQANVKRECGCGRSSKMMQCYLKEAILCDAQCDKLLNCELHSCAAKCHEGKCEPCAEKVLQHCHCSKQERQVACTRESNDKLNYSCGKPCGKDLACGNHKCKDCCHAGECRPCKLSPEAVTSCPCGKMPVVPGQRSSCLDAVPVCEGTCSKTLRCGKAAHPHHCTNKCHLGNCPPCNKQTAVKCRCGHMDQMIKCRQLSTRADDARCKKRCIKKRSCGKHKCNQECCIDIDHICPLPCNYTLSCGKHKCDQPCHRGNCPPCYRSSFEELYCECGAEVIYPPVPCGTKKPICKRPCSRQHPCNHTPQHNCHSAATCPPCMMFTTKWCFGQHEQRKTIPCSQESFSCGLACNKALPCGRHKCIKSCHEGACQTAGEICKQNCTKLRPSCGHKCMAPCHDGDCPETQCKEMVEVQCECGNRKQMRACYDLAREYSRIATAQLASSMAEMQRGNYMELSEILSPLKTNKTNKTLDCNEECRLLERNRRLAIGLQIRNPDVPQKLLTKYSDFIRNFAKRDMALVKSIHDALTTLVKLAKESKQKSRSHSFPTMNREKRQLVHEMCEMFGVESVAYDAEPNRNVVATAYKERSWLPATSIIEIMQRESGQRRVPVPSNNAWGIKR